MAKDPGPCHTSGATSRVTVCHCWALMDIAKNCMEMSEQKCHGKFTNLLVTWCLKCVYNDYVECRIIYII